MAKIPDNHVFAGLSGKVGQFIFRTVNGKTVMTSIPKMSDVPVSKKQAEARSRFKKAHAYAKAINEDPEKSLLYKAKLRKGQTVYQYAMKEFFKNNS